MPLGKKLLNTDAASGASEIISTRLISATGTVYRVLATPTAGKRIRIVSAEFQSETNTLTGMEMYFSTGASITSDASKKIMAGTVDYDAITQQFPRGWPDGAGPIGAVNDPVVFRNSIGVGANTYAEIDYREE